MAQVKGFLVALMGVLLCPHLGVAETIALDERFMKDAARGNAAEMQMGELAKTKAASAGVRNFAERLIADHSQANSKLKELANKRNIELPAELSVAQKSHFSMLEGLSGTAFDSAFTTHMINDHQQDIANFEKHADVTQDTELKAFATSTLPTLREHLSIAKQLKSDTK